MRLTCSFLARFESVCVGNSIILYVVVYLAENDVTWLMEKRDGVVQGAQLDAFALSGRSGGKECL